MSRLAPALRIRRRQLDQLRLMIGSEQARASALASAAADLSDQRTRERVLASQAEVAADPWFAASRQRLALLGRSEAESQARLATLRQAATDARARLSSLEEADAAARAADRRVRDKAAQAALDDRAAAAWCRA
jgi:chromosome segregation ATPase